MVNPIAKNLNKFNKPAKIRSKRDEALIAEAEAELKEYINQQHKEGEDVDKDICRE